MAWSPYKTKIIAFYESGFHRNTCVGVRVNVRWFSILASTESDIKIKIDTKETHSRGNNEALHIPFFPIKITSVNCLYNPFNSSSTPIRSLRDNKVYIPVTWIHCSRVYFIQSPYTNRHSARQRKKLSTVPKPMHSVFVFSFSQNYYIQFQHGSEFNLELLSKLSYFVHKLIL